MQRPAWLREIEEDWEMWMDKGSTEQPLALASGPNLATNQVTLAKALPL